MRMKRLGNLAVWVVGVVVAWATMAVGDIIHLKAGKVEGTIVRRTATELVVETTAGKVTLNPAEVVRIERKSSPLDLYREMAKQVDPDDGEGHYKLGLWCLDQKLFRKAGEEFRRAIALDPNHKGARERLGYVLRDGQWLTRAEAKQAEGFVRHEGQWVTEEERDADVRREAVNAWRRRLHRAVDRKPMSEEAVSRRIALALGGRSTEVTDAAVRAVLYDLIKEANDKRRDRSYAARVALVEAIGLQKSPKAVELLRRAAILDPDDTVRAVAVQALAPRKSVDDTAYFVGLLRAYCQPRYRVRGDKKARRLARRVLLRASQALGDLGDSRAIPALASYLVVRFHIAENKDEIPPMTIGFSTSAYVGGSVISDSQGNQYVLPVSEGSNFGLGQDESLKKPESAFFFNDAAYGALRKLTRMDFGHDKSSWLAWWYRNRHEFE